MNRKRPEPIAVPAEQKTSYVLTNAGKFTEGDLTISREGMQINAASSSQAASASKTSGAKPSADKASSTGKAAAAGTQGVPLKKSASVQAVPHEQTAAARAGGEASTSELSLDDLDDLGVIGKGSSGVAKKVRNRHTGEVLVLKVIQFDVGSDTTRKQVTTELRTLYGASNAHVVRYHQAFFDNGAITIVMEYMDAGALSDVVKNKTISEAYIAEIARQVVAGLVYLHKDLRIVHRDIKPSNLLLNSRGELKISDFGVSGQLTSSVSNCLSWVGTVTYMSPERIKGDSYSYDSDVWSLGVTLLECALGRFPYPPPGDMCGAPLNFWELLEYIVLEAPPQLPSAEAFSSEFADFIAQCMQKECTSRPSVTDLARHPFLSLHKTCNLADLIRPATAPAAVTPPPAVAAAAVGGAGKAAMAGSAAAAASAAGRVAKGN